MIPGVALDPQQPRGVAEAPPRRRGLLLLAAWLPVVVALTLRPLPEQTYFSGLSPIWCLVCGELGMVDVTLNLLLFVPVGVGLRWLGIGRQRLTLAAGIASLAIELLQLTVITGRDPSLSDLVTNTTGAFLGAVLVDAWPSLVRPSGARSRRAARAATVAWLVSLLLVIWLLEPWTPDPPFVAEWAPHYPPATPFGGEVLAARVGPFAIPPTGRLSLARPLRGVFAEGTPLEAMVISGPPTPNPAPIVVIADEGRRGIARLSQLGRDLVFGAPTRGAQFRLRRPAAVVRGALPREPGDTLLVGGSIGAGVVTARVRGANGTARAVVTLSPNLGWLLVAPAGLPIGPDDRWVTALWIIALLTPLGYYTARGYAGRRRAAAAVGLLTIAVAAGIGLFPALAGWPPAHWSEWLAAAAGLGVGWTTGDG